jgi:hypothetical protein
MELTEAKIRALGDEILKDFGQELYEILDKRLSARLGEGWFQESFRTKSKNKDLAKTKAGKRDTYTLIHQLISEKNNDFRGAIAKEFKLHDNGEYIIVQLVKVLEARNKWSHPDELFTSKDFLMLLSPIYKILGNRNNQLGDRCEELIRIINENLPVNFASFSTAFGQDFRSLERNNELLRNDLRKYRLDSLETHYPGEYLDDDLDSLSREELIEFMGKLNNALVSERESTNFYDHSGRDQLLSERLNSWRADFALLVTLFSADKVINYIEFEDLILNETGRKWIPFKLEHSKDLIGSYFAELGKLVKAVIDLRAEIGFENCSCHYCFLLNKYDLLPGSAAGDMFGGAVRHYLFFQTEDEITEVIDQCWNEWQEEFGFSEGLLNSIFPSQETDDDL